MKHNRSTTSIVVLGGPNTGKTVYGGQLLGRLLYGSEPRLRARHSPESLQAFKDVLDRLSEGLLPEHTSADTYHETELPLENREGAPLDLAWPDYGGEQIRAITTGRTLGESWQARIEKSDAWLLFVRLSRLSVPDDIIARRLAPTDVAKEGPTAPAGMSDQATLIELLQLLLHVRGTHPGRRLSSPALAVVLSAWDEFSCTSEKVLPEELLHQRLPLFADFIQANWQPEARLVLGLSALGKTLQRDLRDDSFINQGAETQGYVILPDGYRDTDLTLPIALLMDRLA